MVGDAFGPRDEYTIVYMVPPVVRFAGPRSEPSIAQDLYGHSTHRVEHAADDPFLIIVDLNDLRPEYRRFFEAPPSRISGVHLLPIGIALGNSGDTAIALRLLYQEGANAIQAQARAMLSSHTTEAVARWVVVQRNQLKLQIRSMGPALFQRLVEWRNLRRYGNPLGPDYAALRATRSDMQIIERVQETSAAFNASGRILRFVGTAANVAGFVLTATQNSPAGLAPLPETEERMVEIEMVRLRLGIPATAIIDRHGHLKKSSYLQIDPFDAHVDGEMVQETEEILWFFGASITYTFEGTSWTVPGR